MLDIKLAVFDVDGTLVSKNSRILLDSTVHAIQELKKRGVKIAIASGRPYYAMERSVIDRINFDYFICSNGSFVYDAINNHEIYKYMLSDSLVMRLTTSNQIEDGALVFQFEDAGYIYQGYKRIANMIQDTLGRLDFLVDERKRKLRHLKSKPYAAIAWIADDQLESYRQRFPMFSFTPFAQNYYDVNPRNVNKATGISHILLSQEWTMDNVIAFGDELNDFEMLSEATYSVAMGNAIETIKEVAHYVTDDTIDNGIKNALLHFGLIEEWQDDE